MEAALSNANLTNRRGYKLDVPCPQFDGSVDPEVLKSLTDAIHRNSATVQQQQQALNHLDARVSSLQGSPGGGGRRRRRRGGYDYEEEEEEEEEGGLRGMESGTGASSSCSRGGGGVRRRGINRQRGGGGGFVVQDQSTFTRNNLLMVLVSFLLGLLICALVREYIDDDFMDFFPS
eukprot:Nk52_evm6s355 gene=Nk52_evmTU6s355